MPGTTSRSALGGEVVVFAGKLSSLDGRAAQRLVEELGGATACDLTERTTMLVLGAEPRPEDTEARALRAAILQRAETLTAGPGRLRIVSELDFCRLAGVVSNRLRQQLYAVRDVHSLYPAVRDDHLRYLEKLGLVRPIARVRGDRLYGFSDLAVIKHVSAALGHGQPLRQVIRALEAERKGQLALDFERAGRTDANPARVVALERPRRSRSAAPPVPAPAREPNPQARLAAKYFLEGAALDIDDCRREQAATAYRKALVVDPDLVPAIVNLANIHYAADRLIEAQALYERALGLEPDCFEAAFNLGNVHHDLGRYDQALGCYGRAVALNPAYADAHFYLAITLEKVGRSAEAKPHWRLYQQLSPNGEWADLAKEFSE